jgi:hydroxymethylbilane synthase
MIGAVNHAATFTAITAERELQRLLSGDCTLPVGVRTTLHGDTLEMSVLLFGPEGEEPRTGTAKGPASEPQRVAGDAFAQLGL